MELLCINCCWTTDNWLTFISLIFVVIGGCFALWQWKKNNKIKQAEFFNQIIEKLRFDENLSQIMYVVDYNQQWYSKSFHNNDKEFENTIDKLFSYLDYVCYLNETNVITKNEFKIFKYEINRVCISVSTKYYLWNLYHFSKKNNTDCSFQYLIDYAIKNKLFPKNFKNNTELYEKTLNW